MKKIALLVEDYYQVLEVWYPYYRLKEAGYNVLFVGPGTKGEYKSKEGYPVKEEMTMKQVSSKDFDGVVVPGGFAPDMMRRYPEMTRFVKEIFDQKKLVAAICHAGWLLVSAQVLKGKKATCTSAIKDDVINAGAIYSDEEVVVDGNLITSRKPDDMPAFCREIVGFLSK
jgi:protease I